VVFKASEFKAQIENIDLYTETIDKKLKSSGYSRFSVEHIRESYDVRERIIKSLIQKYQDAGWKVTREQYSDFRESWDYISIKLPE